MSRTKLNVIIQEVSMGNFVRMLLELQPDNLTIDTYNAVKIIIACNMGLSSSMGRNAWLDSTKDNFLNVLIIVIKHIRTPSDENITHFLQSIYHIVKSLLQANDFQYVLKLKPIIFPKFMPPMLKPEQKLILVGIGTSILKAVNKKLLSEAYPVETFYYDLCVLASVLWYSYADQITYLNNCCSTLYTLSAARFDNTKQNKYYSHVLSFCKSTPADCQEDALFLSLSNFLQLHFSNHLKNGKFKDSILAYQEWSKIVKKVLPSKQYHILCDALEFNSLILNENISNELQTLKHCHTALKTYFNTYRVDDCVKSVCQMIVSTFSKITTFYKNEGKTTWMDLSADIQLKVFNFCADVSHILTKIPFKCTCENCVISFSHYDSVKLLASVSTLAKRFLSETKGALRKYKLDVLQCMEKALASIIVLKESHCERWKSGWCEVGINLYNMCIHMYKLDDADGLSYINVFIKNLIKIEGTHRSCVIGASVSYAALALLTEIYFKANELRKCVVITALLLALFPEHREVELNRWIKIKIAAKEGSLLDAADDVQTITISSALERYRDEVVEYIPEFKLPLSEKIELLVSELYQYKQKWKSKISMMSAYKDLIQVADLDKLIDVTVEIWSDFAARFHDDVPGLIHSVVTKCDAKRSEDIKSAFIYFIYYVFKFKITITKNHIDIEETLNFLKNIEDHKDDLPSHPDNACDIVSSYPRLKIEKHLILTKYLSKSLNLIAALCKSENYLDHFKVWRLGDVYNLLLKIAYEHRMHYNHLQYLHASELALKIANFMEDDLKILIATSNLLDVANVESTYMEQLVERADSIVSKLDCGTEESTRSVVLYYVRKANAYLYVDVPKAHESYQKANALFASWKWKEDLLLTAEVHCIHAKLIMLPCEYKIDGHKEFSLVKIHMAHSCVITVLSKQLGIDTSYKVSVVLDVKETMIKMYHMQKLPREVRCYARDIILLTQEFLLPLRTVSLLTYLSYADLLSGRLDDCNVKIRGISDILSLGKSRLNISPRKVVTSPCKLDDHVINDFASLNIQEVSLDLPQNRFIQRSPGSPTLMLEPFKLPHFVNHNPVCDCFYCNCIEYQTMAFYKTHLEALLYMSQNNVALAQDFFIGSTTMHTHLIKKEKYYIYRACQLIHRDLVVPPRIFYRVPHSYMMLDYCNSLLMLNNRQTPKETNLEMINFLKPFRLKFNTLYMEFVLQKLQIDNKVPVVYTYDAVSSLEPPKIVSQLLLTPESKHSMVTVQGKCSPLETLPRPKRAVKNIRFDLSEPDDTIVPVVKNAPTLAMRTPNPPKNNIYIPDLVKSARRKKTEITQSERLNITVVSASTGLASTSKIPDKLRLGLQSKTKLLTQKLRSSENTEPTKSENNKNLASQANLGRVTRSRAKIKSCSNEEGSERNENGIVKCTGAVKKLPGLNK